jgi:hypothetical protein
VDIVTFTGTGANQTINHNLGKAPDLIIVKERDDADSGFVYHYANGAGASQFLEGTQAKTLSAGYFPSRPTASQFTVGATQNTLGTQVVAYLFASTTGFSAFGSYTGNASTDGPFVYTGFKPRFVLTKGAGATSDWEINDSARNPFNPVCTYLSANLTVGEACTTNFKLDFLANGFKIRGTDGYLNPNGGTVIYAAFADTPFKYTGTGAALIPTSFLLGETY